MEGVSFQFSFHCLQRQFFFFMVTSKLLCVISSKWMNLVLWTKLENRNRYQEWLYVLIMSLTRFRVNLHSIFAWMPRYSLLETCAISEVSQLIYLGLALLYRYCPLTLKNKLTYIKLTYIKLITYLVVCLLACLLAGWLAGFLACWLPCLLVYLLTY